MPGIRILAGRFDAFYQVMSDTHFIRIKHWDNLYENSRSRKIPKARWLPIPNKHDGEGYRRMMSEKDGMEMFAVWNLILQVASKCKPRGTLIRDDKSPMDAEAMVFKVGLPQNKVKIFSRTIDFLLSRQVAWIERVSSQSGTSVPPECQSSAPEENRIEEKGSTDTIVSDSSEPKILSQSKRIKWSESGWSDIIEEDKAKWSEAFPACDISRELAAMHAWLMANPKKSKKSNYARFITTWLSRSQDKGGDAKSNKGSRSSRFKNFTPAEKHKDTDYGKAYG